MPDGTTGVEREWWQRCDAAIEFLHDQALLNLAEWGAARDRLAHARRTEGQMSAALEMYGNA